MSFSINHAFNDKWLIIKVHSITKLGQKPASKMVSEQNIPANTSYDSENEEKTWNNPAMRRLAQSLDFDRKKRDINSVKILW